MRFGSQKKQGNNGKQTKNEYKEQRADKLIK